MSSFIDALQHGVMSVWLPLAALIGVLLYSLWHRWHYRLEFAETVETTADQPEFLRSQSKRRRSILKAGEAFGQSDKPPPSASFKWIALVLALLLLAAIGYGVFRFSDAKAVIEADVKNSDGTHSAAYEEACQKFPGLC